MIIKGYELNGGHYINVVFEMSTGEDIVVTFQDAELSSLDKRLAMVSEYSGAQEEYPDLTELRALAAECFKLTGIVRIDRKRNVNVGGVTYNSLSDVPELRSVTDIIWTPEVKQALKDELPKKQKTEKVMRPYERVEIIDGVAVVDNGEEEVEEAVWEYFPMVDKQGSAVMELVSPEVEAESGLKDKDGKIIKEPIEAKKAVYKQRTHKVPVMEDD